MVNDKEIRNKFLDAFAINAKYWIEYGRDVISRIEPSPEYRPTFKSAMQKDKDLRTFFSKLDTGQKEKVLELIKDCVRGSIFSCLAAIDQFSEGEIEINLGSKNKKGEISKIKIAPLEGKGLHDDFHEIYHKRVIQ